MDSIAVNQFRKLEEGKNLTDMLNEISKDIDEKHERKRTHRIAGICDEATSPTVERISPRSRKKKLTIQSLIYKELLKKKCLKKGGDILLNRMERWLSSLQRMQRSPRR